MQAKHYITLAVGGILLGGLYWFGNTVPPKEPQKAGATQGPQQGAGGAMVGGDQPAKVDSLIAAFQLKLDKVAADSVILLNNKIAAVPDSSGMAVLFEQLSGVWARNGVMPIGAYYRAKVAKLENSKKSLTFAGQLFLELLEHEENRRVQMWEANEAISCMEQALKLDSTYEEAKLAIASAYIQGTGEPMKGVQMLLAITKEKPEDVPANLLLGRMSIQSNQFEKAVKRFETVLKVEPDNKEALYFLAQAWEGAGNKQKAIEQLEKLKKVVNKPEFSKDIDEHINSLK